MPEVSGEVSVVVIKNQTKSGKPLRSPLYSINMNDTWFNFGFDNPKVSKGDSVSFEAKKDQYGMVGDASSVVVNSSVGNSAGSSVAVVATSSNNRQNSIVYQSSRKDAINVVGILLDVDAISLPAKKDKMDVILSLVDTITEEYAVAALNPEINDKATALVEEVEDE
jgi:hypothetical protein